MGWLAKQKRLTSVYCFVVAQLNDVGIRPEGNEIKPWIRQELVDENFQPTREEIGMVLSGLLQEKAITQEQINGFMARHAKKITVN